MKKLLVTLLLVPTIALAGSWILWIIDTDLSPTEVDEVRQKIADEVGDSNLIPTNSMQLWWKIADTNDTARLSCGLQIKYTSNISQLEDWVDANISPSNLVTVIATSNPRQSMAVEGYERAQ